MTNHTPKFLGAFEIGSRVRVKSKDEGNFVENYNIRNLEAGNEGTLRNYALAITFRDLRTLPSVRAKSPNVSGTVMIQAAIIKWDNPSVSEEQYFYTCCMLEAADKKEEKVEEPAVEEIPEKKIIDDPDFIFRPRSTKTFYRGFP